MPRIAIQPPELRNRAQQIEAAAGAIEQEINNVEQAIDLLRPTFIGETAQSFFTKFDDRRAMMKNWDDVVRRYAERLRIIANQMEITDRTK